MTEKEKKDALVVDVCGILMTYDATTQSIAQDISATIAGGDEINCRINKHMRI